MHPLNSANFGSTGMAVSFYNGTSTVPGYIVKQLSQNRFTVTDGTHVATGVYLAPTTTLATSIGSSHPQYFTIPVNTYGGASGATFTPLYTPNTMTCQSAGNGYFVGDVLSIDGTNSAQVTITSIADASVGSVGGFTISTAGDGISSFPTNPQDSEFQSGGASFHGQISGSTLTVTEMISGTIYLDQSVTGLGVIPGLIMEFGSGTGGTGTYTLEGDTQTVASEVMNAGGNFATFDITSWTLASVSIGGDGVGYTADDALVFNGIVANPVPVAYVGSVSGGSPASVVVETPGTITGAATSVGTTGPIEYVRNINQSRLITTAGHSYDWSLGGSNPNDNSAYIPSFA